MPKRPASSQRPTKTSCCPRSNPRVTEVAQPIPPDWSLVDDEEPAAGEAAPVASQEPNPFGIEKMSAEEFLAPESDDGDDNLLEPGLGLELVSMEEAVAPRASDSEYFAETFLDSAAASVRRVLALVVAQDSEDAARLFLASVPARLPALVVVLQQGDGGLRPRPCRHHDAALARGRSRALRRAIERAGAAAGPSPGLAPRWTGEPYRRRRRGVDATLANWPRPSVPTSPRWSSSAVDAMAWPVARPLPIAAAGSGSKPGDRASATIAGIHAERIESFTGSVAAMAARLIEEFP